MREYPNWTVESCLCTTGNPNSSCPYSQPQDEDLVIKGIYSRYADSAKDIPRFNGYFT